MKKAIKKICDWIICCFVRRNNAVLPQHPRRIGVVLCHWLGDTFWGMQVLPALQRQYPEAEIHIFLRRNFADLFYGLIETDRIHCVPAVISDRKREKFSFKDLRASALSFRELNLELVIDLTGNRYSALFTWWLKAQYSVGFEGDELGMLYDLRAIPEIYAGKPLRLRPLLVTRLLIPDLNINAAPFAPKLKYVFEEVLTTTGLETGGRLAILSPCAGWPEKEWGDDNFARLAASFRNNGWQVIISGTGAELIRCCKIAEQSGATAWSGELGALLALFSGAKIFAGNDSGTGHIAATFTGCHVFTIFTGATSPELLAPAGENVTVVETVRMNDTAIIACITGILK